jgi:hypothetical protein
VQGPSSKAPASAVCKEKTHAGQGRNHVPDAGKPGRKPAHHHWAKGNVMYNVWPLPVIQVRKPQRFLGEPNRAHPAPVHLKLECPQTSRFNDLTVTCQTGGDGYIKPRRFRCDCQRESMGNEIPVFRNEI